MTLPDVALFAGLGAFAGFFAGLLGIGGGAIITPLLVLTFASIMNPAIATHAAIGTAMAVIALTSIPSLLTHARHGAVEWRLGGMLAGGAAVGAFVGSNLANLFSAALLNLLLSLFLFYVSYVMFFPHRRSKPKPALPLLALTGVGGVIGVLSSLLGIGGGAMSTPFLSRQGLSMQKSIGTSSFFNNPVSTFAAAGYIISGWNNTAMPDGSIGYVYSPALIYIAIFSMIFAIIGANLTAKLPEKLLRYVFGTLTTILAVRLLTSSVLAQ
jgi:hypothetical protein